MKEKGIKNFDLGGTIPEGIGAKKTIARFKKSFGGKLQKVYRYRKYNSKLFKFVRQILKR